jgi:hypothetical protein
MNIDWLSFTAGAVTTLVMLFVVMVCLEVSEWLKRRRAGAEMLETVAPRMELLNIRDLEGSESRGA